MAGDGEGERVGRAGGGDGARGGGLPELFGEGGVAEGLPRGDGLERLPDAVLEGGGADVEGEGGGAGVLGEVGEDEVDGVGEPGSLRVVSGAGRVFRRDVWRACSRREGSPR